ncbi:MAG: glycosyltransferase family 4 protein [Lachnospiraceae bacterium]|nr:glycosyltransferase family 4 protein [Lachnospiraceae bacterium]
MIYIDASVLTLATFLTGIQRVTREYSLCFLTDPSLSGKVTMLFYDDPADCYRILDPEKYVAYYRRGEGKKEAMITRRKVEIPDFREGDLWLELDAAWMDRMKRSYLYPRLKERGVRICVLIYDVISAYYPQYCLERGAFNFQDYLGASLLHADHLIFTSNAVREDAKALAEKAGVTFPPCSVIPLGSDFAERAAKKNVGTGQSFETKGSNAETSVEDADAHIPADIRKLAEGKFLLMAGTIEPRKNHKLLLEAYPRLKELGYRIVFAGLMGWNMESFEEQLHAHPDFGNGIYHVVGPTDEVMSALYRKATFLVFCSYSEGYGLPIAEAMQRGTPVLAADVPVLREVGGDLCVWFPQDDADALAEQVAYYDAHPEEYALIKSRIAGYRSIGWEQSYLALKEAMDHE